MEGKTKNGEDFDQKARWLDGRSHNIDESFLPLNQINSVRQNKEKKIGGEKEIISDRENVSVQSQKGYNFVPPDKSPVAQASLHALNADMAAKQNNLDLAVLSHVEASKCYFKGVSDVKDDPVLASSLLMLSNAHARKADQQRQLQQASLSSPGKPHNPHKPAISTGGNLMLSTQNLMMSTPLMDSIMVPRSHSSAQHRKEEDQSTSNGLTEQEIMDDMKQLQGQLRQLGMGPTPLPSQSPTESLPLAASTLEESLFIVGPMDFAKPKGFAEESMGQKRPAMHSFAGADLDRRQRQHPESEGHFRHDAQADIRSVDKLLQTIQTLHDENNRLVKENEEVLWENRKMQKGMHEFKQKFKKKIDAAVKHLEECKGKHSGGSKYDNEELQKQIRALFIRLSREKDQNKKKDEKIHRLENWCKTVQRSMGNQRPTRATPPPRTPTTYQQAPYSQDSQRYTQQVSHQHQQSQPQLGQGLSRGHVSGGQHVRRGEYTSPHEAYRSAQHPQSFHMHNANQRTSSRTSSQQHNLLDVSEV